MIYLQMILGLGVCWVSLPVSSSTGCDTEPPDLERLKRHLRNHHRHESWLNVFPDESALPTLDHIKVNASGFVSITRSIRQLPCSRVLQDAALAIAQKHTTCPWYYVKNEDPNREPETVWEARCDCNNLWRCQPVINHIRVLRRTGCYRFYYIYEEVSEPVAVGCTRVRRLSTESMMPSSEDSDPHPQP